MKPSGSYIFSSFVFSLVSALLVSYPSASIFKDAQWAPSFAIWALMTFVLTFVLTFYSSIEKSKLLLSLNWLIIIVTCLILFVSCWAYNPESVLKNAGMLVFFSIFTFGGPFWLLLISFIYHASKCGSIENNA